MIRLDVGTCSVTCRRCGADVTPDPTFRGKWLGRDGQPTCPATGKPHNPNVTV